MKKIYYIYAIIPEYLYNKKIKYLFSSQHDFRWKHGNMYGLYAWSTSKKKVKEFFEVREKSIYTVVKSDLYDDSEIARLKDMHSDLELKRRRYYYDDCKNDEDSILITSTKNEHVSSTEFSEEFINEFGPQVSEMFSYSIFKDKVIRALDILGYTTRYDIEYGNDQESDLANYNLGFNLNTFGNPTRIKFDNQMNNLIYLYSYFFYGNDKNIKDDL